VKERKGQFVYVIEQCPICWGRTTTYPAGALAQGILEEALTWVSGGHTFAIEQTDCQGLGCERCIFAVGKAPLD
jgi:predicted hydrocarbon binding protein